MPKRLRSYNRMIRQLPQVEKKYKDVYFVTNGGASTAAGATWAPYFTAGTVTLTGGAMLAYKMAQGAGASERIGQKIYVHSAQIKLRLRPDANPDIGQDAQSNNFVRVVMFIDKQANGSQPVLISEQSSDNAILNEISSSKTVVGDRNLGASARYRILYDRIHSLNPQVTALSSTNAAYQPQTKIVSIYKKFKKPVTMHFVNGGDTGAPSEVQSNNIWCAVLCDYQNPESVRILGNSRMRYTDA